MKILILLLLASCAHKVVSDGGQASFDKETYETLSPEDVTTYAQTIVKREARDPEKITLDKMRKLPPGDIRRVGIVVFETEIQPTRTGLGTDRNAYLSPRGKQIITQTLLESFKQDLRDLSAGTVEWINHSELVKSKAYRSAGSIAEDFILKKRDHLTEEDLFWKSLGQKIPERSLLSPREFQEVGALLIPATQLMGGAKPSQHQHHWVNDICKELNLDAVLIAYAGAEWRRGGVDKRTKEVIPEVVKTKVEATLMYPWGAYHEAAAMEGEKENVPKVNVPLASYSTAVTTPVVVTVAESEETFETAMKNIVDPTILTLERLFELVAQRITTDVMSTHQTTVGAN